MSFQIRALTFLFEQECEVVGSMSSERYSNRTTSDVALWLNAAQACIHILVCQYCNSLHVAFGEFSRAQKQRGRPCIHPLFPRVVIFPMEVSRRFHMKPSLYIKVASSLFPIAQCPLFK